MTARRPRVRHQPRPQTFSQLISTSSFWRHAAGQAGHRALLSDLAIAEGVHDFQDLTPGRERTTVFALVLVHCLHEFDFVVIVVALAGGWINLAPTFAFLVAAIFAGSAFQRYGDL